MNTTIKVKTLPDGRVEWSVIVTAAMSGLTMRRDGFEDVSHDLALARANFEAIALRRELSNRVEALK